MSLRARPGGRHDAVSVGFLRTRRRATFVAEFRMPTPIATARAQGIDRRPGQRLRH